MKRNLKSVISFVVALALSLSSFAAFAAVTYDDVPADATYAEAVSNLTAIGIVEGYGDGKFNPDNQITRAEVAAMIVRALAQNDAALSSQGATNFTDVAADHWASGYVNVASRGTSAFINGMGDGTFAPEANVTYAQVVKMLVAGIGYGDWGVAKGGYPTGYIATAKELGITNGVTSVNADDQATRAVVAQLINNAINTPLLALKTYSPTNPEYVVMDGTNDNDYETVLTYYHNIYAVEGRVTATNKSASGAVDSDEVKYRVEVTKNYGSDALVAKRNNEDYPSFEEKMYIGDTDAADYLNVYSKALVKVNDDDESTIIAFTASGKNTSVAVKADAYDDDKYDLATAATELLDPTSGNKGEIWYYSSSEKTGKSSRYYVADGFQLFVNGVEMDLYTYDNNTVSGVASDGYDLVTKYVLNNTTGEITFVDTPAEGSVTTDGKYDAIFVSYYGTAIVDSVQSNGKVSFDSNDATDGKTSVTFDDEDDDLTYSIKLNGEEIAFTDLQQDDVLNIAYNVGSGYGFANSNFYDVLVTRGAVEGEVSETDEDENCIYINGTTYDVISSLVTLDEFELGTSYTTLVDAFGRIVKKEKLSTSVKYGIVARAYVDQNTEDKTVVIYDTTATSKSFVVKENSDAEDSFDAGLLVAKSGDDIHTVDTAEKCVVEYEVSASGELRKITYLSASTAGDSGVGTYSDTSSKIGSVRFSDSSVIIYKDGNDYSVVKGSSLVDDAKYTAYGFDKESGNNYYNFVLITDGIGSYVTDTRFAVVNKVTTTKNTSGDSCEKLSVYVAGNTDLQEVCTEETGIASGLSKGDVIVYKLNANGDIDEITMLFDNDGVYQQYATTLDGDFSGLFSTVWEGDADVELKFGPVVAKSSSGVSIGEVGAPDVTLYNSANTEVTPTLVTNIDDTEELSYASNVAVYVYDYNEGSSSILSAGNGSSVPNPSLAKVQKLYTEKNCSGDAYIDWNSTSIPDGTDATPNYTYAFAKVVEDEVTDLFVIIPKDE